MSRSVSWRDPQSAYPRLLIGLSEPCSSPIPRRPGFTVQKPTSEAPEVEEVDLLKRKMAVSKRVTKLAAHFESTIFDRLKDEGEAPSGH